MAENPRIKIILEHEAEDELKEVYRKIREQRQGENHNYVIRMAAAFDVTPQTVKQHKGLVFDFTPHEFYDDFWTE